QRASTPPPRVGVCTHHPLRSILTRALAPVCVESGPVCSPASVSGEHPLVVADDRHLRSAAFDSVDLYLGTADHEIGVDVRHVVGSLGERLVGIPRERETCAVGNVTGRVLVEQRVEERDAELTYARRTVDEGDLPE